MEALAAFNPPPEVWEAAEEEVRLANGRPTGSGADKERARLTRRLEALRKEHEWGDITDEEYRRLTAETRDRLSAMPGEDGKVAALHRMRRVAASFGDAIAASSTHPELFEGLVPLVVKRIDVAQDGNPVVAWTDEWVLLFGAKEVPGGVSLWRPRTDSNRRRQP
jgi:hypothetical protein